MRICVITGELNSYPSTKFFEEAIASHIKPTMVSWRDIFFNEAGIFLKTGESLKKFQAVILRSDSSSLTPGALIVEYCKQNNIRLLNEVFYSRYQSVNKLRQQLIFQTNKTPCLKTFYGENISFSLLKKELGMPFIAKFANGSQGKQVFKIARKKDFQLFMKEQKKARQLCLFQKFYKIDADYRFFVIGEKVFGSVKRIAPKGEWKTNMHGSAHERAEKNSSALKLIKNLIKKTSLEFAGIDILFDSQKKPRIIELNTMADFKVFDKYFPEVNIAKQTIALLKKTLL